MKIAVTTIVKNEAATLLEWIAYHRAVGIEHFIIIDNDSTDGTWQLLKKLARRGWVKAVRFKTLAGQAPQVDAYQKVLNGVGRQFDVLAVIDADEYLLPTDGADSVVPFIQQRFADSTVSAVALNWACFGSAGAVFKEDALVPERFLRRSEDKFFINQHYKSLVRPSAVVRFINPHEALLASGHYVRADGERLIPNEKFPNGLSQGLCWQGLRVNHYVVKSLEEFLVRKSRVGSASQAGRVKHRKFFEGHDRNELLDESIMPFMPETHRILEQLQTDISQLRGSERWLNRLTSIKQRWDYQRFIIRRSRLYGAACLRHKKLYKNPDS